MAVATRKPHQARPAVKTRARVCRWRLTPGRQAKGPLRAFALVRGPFYCAPEGTRTPNLLIRSQMLYPLSYGRRSLQTEDEDTGCSAGTQTVRSAGPHRAELPATAVGAPGVRQPAHAPAGGPRRRPAPARREPGPC